MLNPSCCAGYLQIQAKRSFFFTSLPGFCGYGVALSSSGCKLEDQKLDDLYRQMLNMKRRLGLLLILHTAQRTLELSLEGFGMCARTREVLRYDALYRAQKYDLIVEKHGFNRGILFSF